MSDNVEVLKEALTQAHDRGYAKGRVDSLKALSTSMQFVYDLGVLAADEKKGYNISLETVNAALKILEQDNEERGL